jgi:hypothetical protein
MALAIQTATGEEPLEPEKLGLSVKSLEYGPDSPPNVGMELRGTRKRRSSKAGLAYEATMSRPMLLRIAIH